MYDGLKKLLNNNHQLDIFSNNTKKLINEKFNIGIERFEEMFNYAINNKT